MKKLFIAISILLVSAYPGLSQEDPAVAQGVFDDAQILEGYTREYLSESRDVILARINDDAITNPYQMSAAIRVLREKYLANIVGREKIILERDLIRRINRTNSAFVEVEVMHALSLLDRYKYFNAMVPALILKLDHYNPAVNDRAEAALDNIIALGKNSPREARVVFNTLRKVLFLSRNTLRNVTTPDKRLSAKLKILRYSIKILGTEELRRLPKEVIRLI